MQEADTAPLDTRIGNQAVSMESGNEDALVESGDGGALAGGGDQELVATGDALQVRAPCCINAASSNFTGQRFFIERVERAIVSRFYLQYASLSKAALIISIAAHRSTRA